MDWLTGNFDLTSATDVPFVGTALVALVVLFVVFDGYLLAGGTRRRQKSTRFVLGPLEAHLLWTLVPVALIVVLLKLPTQSRKTPRVTRQTVPQQTEKAPEAAKVLFE